MKLIITLFFLSLSSFCCTQSKETSNSLKSKIKTGKVTAQEILLDEQYMNIHHTDSFRAVMKSFAPNGFLTIANNTEPGEKIKVYTIVKDEAGNLLQDVLVYLYQTDNNGYYGENTNPRLFGYVHTDTNGRIEVETIKPVGYPNSEAPRHIHIEIYHKGYKDYISEFLFDDDERLTETLRKDMLRQGVLISSFDNSQRNPSIEYIVVLKK